MGWRTVVVNSHSKLSYKNNYLTYKDAYKTELIHLSELDILLLETTDISITTMLLKRLVDEKVLVIFCDDKRLPKALLQPFYNKHDSSLQVMKQVSWKEEQKAKVWTEIISQKIINQSLHLADIGYTTKSQAIMTLHDCLEEFDPTNREGHAARIYFNTLFGNDFSREANNDINISLDYGYSLLLSMFAREIVATGCITQLGLKHANQYNPFNLASDLMEPFRPIIDRIVFSNRFKTFQQIKPHLFAIFYVTFSFKGKEMYLSNIISEYTKKTIKVMNEEGKDVPIFRI